MHESEKNRLEKRMKALILGAHDMREAGDAARHIERGSYGMPVDRLLEVAMSVSYMRPFTQSSLMTLKEFIPSTKDDPRGLHKYLETLRDKAHAHTDKSTSRRVTWGGPPPADEADWVPYVHMDEQFPKELLGEVIKLCDTLHERMLREARRTWMDLGCPEHIWV
jgi:hypothetical protein